MKELNNLIKKAELAQDNTAKLETVGSVMAVYGYTAERMVNDRNILSDARKAVIDFEREHGEQDAAYAELTLVKEYFHKEYIKHVRLARVALKAFKAGWNELALNGRRKFTMGDYLAQADVFYTNLMGSRDYTSKMAKFGQDIDTLSEARNMLDDLKAKYAAYKKEKGEAEKSTEQKYKAADALAEWYSDFCEVAKVAFMDDPQMLETIGILARSN